MSGTARLPPSRVQQRIVEIEAEQPRILANHRGRDYVEDILLGLVRDLVLVLYDQPPVVPFPRIGWHFLPIRRAAEAHHGIF